ncbi:MAG: HEPN domain-containing protein, partial [Chloroflexi bacterium]|nr:HEPN domain-containing protein [Chloroflexota bacterium]
FWETDFNFADLATNFQLWFKPHAEISEWEEIGEPVAQNIQREGIVLEGEPVHVKKIEKTRLAHTEMVSARNALAATEHLLNGGFYADSISKAYYVYLYVARAALVAQGITPQSHSGTNKMFGLYLVKPGMVPEKFGHLFGKMEQDRVEADYKHEYVFTREDAERAIERARELLAIIEDLVPRLLNE